MAYKIIFKFSWKKYCCLQRFLYVLFSLSQSQKKSLDSSLSHGFSEQRLESLQKQGLQTPPGKPVPVTHCPPGQNSRSASQTAIFGCCHLVLLQTVDFQWSLQLPFHRLCPQPPLYHREQAQLPPVLPEKASHAHLHKAPPVLTTPWWNLGSFSKYFCPGVHTLKVSTDTQPHQCHLTSARKRRISVLVVTMTHNRTQTLSKLNRFFFSLAVKGGGMRCVFPLTQTLSPAFQ